MQPVIDKAALELFKSDPKLAVEFLTNYSMSSSVNVFERWQELWKSLVVKYNDGYINDVAVERGRHPKGVGYSPDFLKEVINEKPDYYKVKWREKK